MAASDEAIRQLIRELITESATAEVALWTIGLSGAVLIASITAQWWLGRRHDPLANSRVFPAFRASAVVAAFAILTQQVQEAGWLTGVDASTLSWFTLHRTGAWSTAALAVSKIGSPAGVSIIAVFLGGLAVWRSRSARPAIVLLSVLSITAGANMVVKLAVNRSRPPTEAQLVHASGLSYPSGHAAGTTVLVGAMLLIYLPIGSSITRRLIGLAIAVLTVTAVAMSRLYLGVHWLTDMAGGTLLGSAVVIAATALIHTPRSQKPAGVLVATSLAAAEPVGGFDSPSTVAGHERPT